MEKKLVRIGNSFGLVIDRALCRMVGIGPATPLRLSAVNGRLVIEPAAVPLTTVTDANLMGPSFYALVRELIERHHMTQAQFAKLHHAPTPAIQYAMRSTAVKELEPDEAASRRRLKACLIALRAQLDWPEAIASALREAPLRASEVPVASA